MELSFASLSLSAAFLAASYLIQQSYTPPNPWPAPAQTWKKDTLYARQNPRKQKIFLAINLLIWLYHILLIVSPPSSPSIICPNPSQLDQKLFAWTPYTTSFLLLAFIAAPIRLLAYRQLGQNFTFQLTKPKSLVTTGLYAYVRHPSYPTLFACHVATAALVLRSRGLIGCWIPSWLASFQSWDVGGLVLLGIVALRALWVRVGEEEEMLRVVFGEEYEAYARKTMRFLPGII